MSYWLKMFYKVALSYKGSWENNYSFSRYYIGVSQMTDVWNECWTYTNFDFYKEKNQKFEN